MTDPFAPPGPYAGPIAAEVAALENDIRLRVVDLEEAFAGRDWATVARIYREVAAIADRLESARPERPLGGQRPRGRGDGGRQVAPPQRARGRRLVGGGLALSRRDGVRR